jgi:hypothetical protein
VGQELDQSSEHQALEELEAAVAKAADRLDPDSPWAPTLALFQEELAEGQPFFFKFAFASSSKSMSETPVAAE